MTVLHSIGYILPLALLPFFTRTLGPEGFGLYIFAQSIIILSLIFSDFGFSVAGLHRISKARSKRFQKHYITSAQTAKITISLLVSAVLFIGANAHDVPESVLLYYYLAIILYLTEAIQLQWVYQGLQRIKEYTRVAVPAKLTQIPIYYLLIDGIDDIYFIPATLSIINMYIALCTYQNLRHLKLLTVPSSIKSILIISKSSANFLISRFFSNASSTLTTIVIGASSMTQEVAYFGAAQQIYRGAKGIMSTLSSVLFPHMTKHSKSVALAKAMVLSVVISIIMIIVAALYSDNLSLILFGSDFSGATFPLAILLIAAAVNSVSVLLGFPLATTLNKVDLANKSVIFGSASLILFLSLLYISGHANAINCAIAVLSTEIIVLSFRTYVFRWGIRDQWQLIRRQRIDRE